VTAPADRLPPNLTGWHHLSLTVSNLDRSVPWYRDLLGFELLGDEVHAGGRTVVLTQGSFGFTLLLQQHKAHEGSSFSEHRPGLDHLAFRVTDRDALDAWADWLDDRGVDHQPIIEEVYGSVLIFRDPDRIQLELFADPRRATP
jgi:glyoxylase I family protein